MNEPSQDLALRVALLEAEQHQEIMQRRQRVIDLIGILGPVLGALILLALAVPAREVHESRIAAVFGVLMAAGGLLLHFNWVEFLELIRYKYCILYPRLFALAGHRKWINFLEFTTPRSLRSWVPAFYYNVVAMLALLLVWCGLLLAPARENPSVEAWALCLFTGAAILATLRTSLIVLIAARTLERDVKFSSGQPLRPPEPFTSTLLLIPRGDGRNFMLAAPLRAAWRLPASGQLVTTEVPAGFVSDLASVPRFLWPLFPPWERYGPAAILHDYLYSLPDSEWPRLAADRAFRTVMSSLGVGRGQGFLIYLAVRCFGGSSRRVAASKVVLDESARARVLERFELGELERVY